MAKIAQAVHQMHTDPATLIGMDSLSHNKIGKKYLPEGVHRTLSDPTTLFGMNALSSADTRFDDPKQPLPAPPPSWKTADPRAASAARGRSEKRRVAEQNTLLGPGI